MKKEIGSLFFLPDLQRKSFVLNAPNKINVLYCYNVNLDLPVEQLISTDLLIKAIYHHVYEEKL